MKKWRELKRLILVICLCIISICALTPRKNKVPDFLYVEKISRVRMLAVGDNLIHSPIYKSCETKSGYDFSPVYENIAPYIREADISAINQETIFVNDKERLSGYPAFGSPCEVGVAVKNAGFNVITHATNHTYDKGVSGIEDTLSFWKKYKDITVLGINESAEDAKKVSVVSKNGIDISMLNFTYGLNGYKLTEGKKHLVNVLDYSEETKALVKSAEEAGDITVVFLHFGTEYTHTPTKSQEKDVEFLASLGVDLIIGTHPHVVQPVREFVAQNGNRCVVFYSLGNFISNQDSISKILGGAASVCIVKNEEKTFIESYEMLPTVTHVSERKYKAYMLKDYTDELAKKHTRVPNLTVEKLNTLFEQIKKM